MELNTRRTILLSSGIIAVTILLGVLYAPQLPDQLVVGWEVDGTPKDTAGKTWALMFMPGVAIALLSLFLVLPRIDPLRENIRKFREYYNGFIVLMIGYILVFELLILGHNLGVVQNPEQFMLALLGPLFYYSGVLSRHAKRNWFIGIRTPWTLSSDAVWEQTHQIGSTLFKVSGVVALFSIVAGKYSIYLALGPILVSSIFLFVYSYWLYQKQER